MATEGVLQLREQPQAAAQAAEVQPPARCHAVRALGRLGLEPRHVRSGWAGDPAARRFALDSERLGAQRRALRLEVALLVVQRRARALRPEAALLVVRRRVPAARPEAALLVAAQRAVAERRLPGPVFPVASPAARRR